MSQHQLWALCTMSSHAYTHTRQIKSLLQIKTHNYISGTEFLDRGTRNYKQVVLRLRRSPHWLGYLNTWSQFSGSVSSLEGRRTLPGSFATTQPVPPPCGCSASYPQLHTHMHTRTRACCCTFTPAIIDSYTSGTLSEMNSLP